MLNFTPALTEYDKMKLQETNYDRLYGKNAATELLAEKIERYYKDPKKLDDNGFMCHVSQDLFEKGETMLGIDRAIEYLKGKRALI